MSAVSGTYGYFQGHFGQPSVDGNLLIGPNAQDQEEKEDLDTTSVGLAEVLDEALDMMPDLPVRDAITNFAGLRAVARPSNDFVLGPAPGVPNFINAAGIQSPGLTSTPALAEMVRDFLQLAGLELKGKSKFNPYRQGIVTFCDKSREQQAELIEHNPRYGRIVCRCETVTEAEIVQALNRPVPCTTVDGVKRRTHAGMGRCQAGFVHRGWWRSWPENWGSPGMRLLKRRRFQIAPRADQMLSCREGG